jgi:hypothetical protein
MSNSCGASVSTVQAANSATLDTVPSLAVRSRKARVRRPASMVAVVSVTGWNSPPMPPLSSRIGDSEKVKKVSSKYPFGVRNIRWFSRKLVSPARARSNGAPMAGQALAQVTSYPSPSARGCASPQRTR